MSLREELPFRSEYAKSGRSACKTCKELISNGSLRMAVMVQSPFFDGKQPNWHHFECFFKKYRPKSGAEIEHFAQLRFEDQKRIETTIEEALGLKTPEDNTGNKKKTTKKKKSSESKGATDGRKGQTIFADFKVEYAKSNRSKCRLCENQINKNDIRISRLDRESEDALRFGPLNRWFHVECFVSSRVGLNFYASAEKIPFFDQLEPSDQTLLKKKLPQIEEPIDNNIDESEIPLKKKKPNTDSEDKALKKQSDLLFKFQDNLEDLKKQELIELLDLNEIEIPEGLSSKIERLADAMAFGRLEKCPECSGQLVFRMSGYICTGNATEWAKCVFQTDKPKRKAFKVPKDLAQKYDFLKSYKYSKRDRIYVAVIQEAVQNAVASTSKADVVLPKKEENGQKLLPLTGYKVYSTGKLKISRPQLKAKLEKLGATLVSNMDRTTLCVITNKKEVEVDSTKIKDAKDLNIHVVSEEFVNALENDSNPIQAISLNLLAEWGGEVERRFLNLNVKEKLKSAFKSGMSSGRFSNSGPSTQKMVLKGGNAVDPSCELKDVTHILKDGKDIYNAILNKVDLTANKNSYYKLQLLEHDTKKSKYWVFRAWGRVGTTIGGDKLDSFKSKEAAIQLFKDLYLEKTSNDWENRNSFKKKPNCFFPVDIDYGGDEQIAKLVPGNSQLPKPVQDLICMIFDVQKMKEAMLEFELDLEKMPLGKLSKKQLLNACSVLKEISQLIETKPPNNTKLTDAANRFYTLVPHNFGTSRPPLIDNEEIIAQKMQMLEALLDIEMAYEMMTSNDGNEALDPIDQHYRKLKTNIEPLDRDTEDYSIIEKYVKNTHASTHHFNLEILEVLKVERNGEYDRFKKFKDIENKMLLWHGSRVTNYPGILSQGLRIAPPEAPVTGYMFGKGIYFADMVTKSANYCCHHMNNNVGLLLLSEVAIGSTYELTAAKDVKKLPKNKHSVKGCGRTEPDPNETHVMSNGVKVPLGKAVETKVEKHTLLYNEYVVYNVDQVNIKYLLKVKFNNQSLF